MTKILLNLRTNQVSGLCSMTDKLVTTLCDLSVDLRALPDVAFQLNNGDRGQYYEVVYNLALRFGPELTFEFRYGERVIGKVAAQYN
jgi:hypothetical protein